MFRSELNFSLAPGKIIIYKVLIFTLYQPLSKHSALREKEEDNNNNKKNI
jgi:hypothetical protein